MNDIENIIKVKRRDNIIIIAKYYKVSQTYLDFVA